MANHPFDRVTRFLYGAAALSLILILLLMIGRIFSRNFGLGWAGLQLYAQHLAGWLTFLVVGNLAWNREHIEIDYFSKKLPDRVQPIHDILVSLLNISTALVIMVGSILAIMTFWRSTSPSVNIPIPLYYSAALVGFAFLVGVWTHRIYGDIQVLRGLADVTMITERADARTESRFLDTSDDAGETTSEDGVASASKDADEGHQPDAEGRTGQADDDPDHAGGPTNLSDRVSDPSTATDPDEGNDGSGDDDDRRGGPAR